MDPESKIRQIIDISWLSFKNKVASNFYDPENEKMMQLFLAQTIQSLIPIFEFKSNETIKVFLETPVTINRIPDKRLIDIVIYHNSGTISKYFPIELKCFRKFTRDGSGKRRGAQNLGMFDYWADIENNEQYTLLPEYSFSTHLTLTDDSYYVTGRHMGSQVQVYSTNNARVAVTGILEEPIANRHGRLILDGTYSMTGWETIGEFSFIRQEYSR